MPLFYMDGSSMTGPNPRQPYLLPGNRNVHFINNTMAQPSIIVDYSCCDAITNESLEEQ
ncbi:hypothetical protein M2277_002049 [Paenibacillus sp. LBL]|uniref:hypothetical protein n=1 Tax=Paenibacillus TaxID=44249 RepID=UPI002474881B|nr:hypothetical protein [Paenibacillus sp. LBL]MDH6671399.1 hypothetical protein [Paenibacillus sp. LBL]